MILALDFDGVIWDSVGECFVMARRAYQNLYGLPCADLEAAFRRGRWLVRTGGDFLLILQLAMADPEGDLGEFSPQRFDELRQQHLAECQSFVEEFYALRALSRDQHWQEWVSYQQPYPVFLKQLEVLRDQGLFQKMVICTTKDAQSARMLLQSAGLELPIYGRESALHKGEQIGKLCQEYGVKPQQIFFLDDLIENLEQVRPTGARCALAAWGYNTRAERERARHMGYPVIEVFSAAQDIARMANSA